jgi:hypothetical protein
LEKKFPIEEALDTENLDAKKKINLRCTVETSKLMTYRIDVDVVEVVDTVQSFK